MWRSVVIVIVYVCVWGITADSSGAQLLWWAAAAAKVLMSAAERIEHIS